VINDMPKTKELIVRASRLPISIVIVGVGNANFEPMDVLDGDTEPLEDNHKNRAEADIVQFVPFRKFSSNGARLAAEVLREIPSQMQDYYGRKRIRPLAPPPPQPQMPPQPAYAPVVAPQQPQMMPQMPQMPAGGRASAPMMPQMSQMPAGAASAPMMPQMPGTAPSAPQLATAGTQMFRAAVHATHASNAFASAGSGGLVARLQQLGAMKEQGLLSEAEFDQAKQRLLAAEFDSSMQ
jgi:hypothetical protein